jgi:hypothetical protein
VLEGEIAVLLALALAFLALFAFLFFVLAALVRGELRSRDQPASPTGREGAAEPQ